MQWSLLNWKLQSCSSVQQKVNADLLCIEAPNDNKVNTISFPTSSLLHLSPKQIVGPERLEIVPAAAKLLVAPFDDILLY